MNDESFALQSFPQNSVVSGSIVRINESGVLLALPSGVQGYIPNRELAWAGIDDVRQELTEGQEVEALVLREDRLRHQLILSRRLLLQNPWEGAEERYLVGSLHAGRVSQVMDYGVFVDLEQGVTGLVHVSEIPQLSGSGGPIELWPEDDVLVIVYSVDVEARRISLSIKAALAERRSASNEDLFSDGGHGSTIEERLRSMLGTNQDLLTLPWYDSDRHVHHIFLLDDEMASGPTISGWLNELGYELTCAATVAEARTLLAVASFDLYILDYHLPDGHGLDLATLVRSREPDAPIIILSALDTPFCMQEPLIPRLSCWHKPLLMEDFNDLLKAAEAGTCLVHGGGSKQPRIKLDPVGLSEAEPSLVPLKQLADQRLERLVAEVWAEAGLVVAVDGGSQQVHIVARVGATLADEGADLHQLIYSPVNEICMGNETIRVKDVSRQGPRFRYLLPLATFSAFLGTPVPTEAQSRRLGILLFHRDSGHFSEQHEQQARLSAGFFALAIDRQHLLRTAIESRQVILAGLLSRGLAHEVLKQIQSVANEVDLLNIRLGKLDRATKSVERSGAREQEVLQTGRELRRLVSNMARLMQHQLDLGQPYFLREFDLTREATRWRAILELAATEANVRLTLALPDPLPRIYSAPLLIEQIILNLSVNALQQISGDRASMPGAAVRLTVQYKPNLPLPIRISISDTGPGIHAAHKARLFQYGFTTRIGGTGQGLYLSRSAARALGGDLQLVESFVGVGSAFELQLPLRSQEIANE